MGLYVKGMETDYRVYRYTRSEWVINIFKYGLIICFISYLFFDSLVMAIVISPMIIFAIKAHLEEKKSKRLARLNLEFKEMINFVASGLNAGYSMENAFRNARKDIRLIYPSGSYIEEELKIIVRGIDNSIPIERLISDFADRCGLEDVYNFSEVIKVAKKTGGDTIKIIGKTVENISDKIGVAKEIDTLMAGKVLEQKIMSIMPFLIVLYIRLSNGSYMSVLYHNPMGIGVMAVCLILTLVTNMWAKKLIAIEV